MDSTCYPDLSVVNRIGLALIGRRQTVAIAESVTSGDLQVLFSLADNAMEFYQGGITTYNIVQKVRLLQVDPATALATNCVDVNIAFQMAKSVCKLFSSDWGIGITGYASPVPEKGIDKLFAYYAACFRGEQVDTALILANEDNPGRNRLHYCDEILNRLRRLVKEKIR